MNAALLTLIGGADLSSRRWIWEQYDHMVMADTVGRPGGDAGVVRIHGTNRALAIASDCTPRYCHADPLQGGRQAVAESWRNITATGAQPLAVTDNMNFGNPERPEIMGQFVGCAQGMGEACAALDYPVVSGNVSLYNETEGRGILPTPVIGGVGLIDDLAHFVTAAFRDGGETVVLIGETAGWLGQSVYLRDIEGRREGAPPPVDLAAERRNGDFVRDRIRGGAVTACHDLADGGLAVALAEMAIAGDVGCTVALDFAGEMPAHAALFGEDQGRYLLTTADPAALLEAATEAGVTAAAIGTTGGATLTLGDAVSIPVERLCGAHEGWFPGFMASAT
jgi:phosphoribosylformylglycinamidine synthase